MAACTCSMVFRDPLMLLDPQERRDPECPAHFPATAAGPATSEAGAVEVLEGQLDLVDYLQDLERR